MDLSPGKVGIEPKSGRWYFQYDRGRADCEYERGTLRPYAQCKEIVVNQEAKARQEELGRGRGSQHTVRYVGEEGSTILKTDIDEVISETHVSPSGLSIIIGDHLVLGNTQLLKDCLLLYRSGAHDRTTLATLVLFDCYSGRFRAATAHSSSSRSASWKLGGYETGIGI